MSRYDDDDNLDFDAPLSKAERKDYAQWRADREAQEAAKKPKPINWDVDPNAEALKAGRELVENGGTRDEALAAHFGKLVEAAANGDPRVAPQYPEPRRY